MHGFKVILLVYSCGSGPKILIFVGISHNKQEQCLNAAELLQIMSFLCETEGKALVSEACGLSDAGETQTRSSPDKSAGICKGAAELWHEEFMAEDFRESLPETSNRTTNTRMSEKAEIPH